MKPKQLMYLGERVVHFGKIQQLFKSKTGEEHYYAGIKSVWFGGVYETVEDMKMKVRPKEIATLWQPTEAERTEYEAQKLVVTAERQSKRKAMELKKPHKNIVQAVELMRPFYLYMSNLDRRRFMQWFENECSKRKKRK